MKKAAILALLCATLAPAFARAGTNLGSSLKVWGVIHQGDYLVSPSQKYFAILQGDSNLVVYQGTVATGGPAVWSTGTYGRATQSHAVLQGDGNFVLYAGPEGAASGVLWAAASNAGGTSTVTLDDTGALAVCSVDASGAVTSMRWSSGGRNIGWWLPTSSFFRTNDYLVSPGRKFSAVLQPDGNLVIVDGYRGYNGTGAVRWATNSGGHTGPAYASLQPDGNFVIYAGTGPSDSRGSWWAASSTGGNGQSVLVLDDLGTLRVYNGTYTSIGTQRWAGPGDVGLAPTTTVNGLSFVNLRAPSGKWLGSTPDGNLYLTPNASPSSWEQFQIIKMPGYDNYALQTYFGKVVMIGVGGLYSDAFYSTDYGTALLTFYWSYDATLKAIPAPVSGGQVIFGISPNMVLVETPSGLAQQGWSGWPADVARTKYAPWTIVATAPASGTANLQQGFITDPLILKDASNMYVSPTEGTFEQVARHIPGTYYPVKATGSGANLLLWGAEVEISGNAGRLSTGLTTLQQGTGDQPPMMWKAAAASKWRVLDPTGAGLKGRRVPAGAKICLQHIATGKLLSANPSIAELQLSPNSCTPTGSWEHWSFTPFK